MDFVLRVEASEEACCACHEGNFTTDTKICSEAFVKVICEQDNGTAANKTFEPTNDTCFNSAGDVHEAVSNGSCVC